MAKITASDINTLKTNLKAELKRRNNSWGSLTAYAGTSYDFSTAATTSNKILLEHGQKTQDLILLINDYGDL